MLLSIISGVPTASVGTQIVVVIVVGLLTAFAVQFLLTNLGLALGISLIKYRQPAPPNTAESQTKSAPQSQPEPTDINLGLWAGLGIMLTLCSVLFIACFLAVRFSTARDPFSGATLGIVIWSTYFLILIWLSYSAVGSLTSWVFGSVVTKLRQLIEALASSIQRSPASDSELLTEAATANLIQQEIQTALAKFDLQQQVEEYLNTSVATTTPEIPEKDGTRLDLDAVGQGFADLLQKTNLDAVAQQGLEQRVNRQTFRTLIGDRTDLTPTAVEQVASQLEKIWQKNLQRRHSQKNSAQVSDKNINAELLELLKSATPEELQPEQLIKQLESKSLGNKEPESAEAAPDKFQPAEGNRIEETGGQEPLDASKTPNTAPTGNQSTTQTAKAWLEKLDWQAVKNTLVNRVDLSDIEYEDIWHSLQSLYSKINPQTKSQSDDEAISFNSVAFNTIKSDTEDYLGYAPSWYLSSDQGRQKFRQIIYDPEADPAQIYAQLQEVSLEVLRSTLQQRDDLDSQRINEIVASLSPVRQEVFDLVESAGQNSFNASASIPAPVQQPRDHDQELVNSAVAAKTKAIQSKLESYLRYTNLEHLTPAKIAAKLEELKDQADDLSEISSALRAVDLDSLNNVLSKRQGLKLSKSEMIIEQIAAKYFVPQNLEEAISKEADINQPDRKEHRESASSAQSQQIVNHLVDYLYQAVEQNPDLARMEAELSQLFDHDQQQTKTMLNQQLAQLNWQEITAQLQQAKNQGSNQFQPAVKQARAAVRKILKLPRRWASRAVDQAKNTKDELTEFFTYADKTEFTPPRIKHNLQNVLLKAQKNVSPLTEAEFSYWTQLDRDELVDILQTRQDFDAAEIQEIRDLIREVKSEIEAEIAAQQRQEEETTAGIVQSLLQQTEDYLQNFDLSHLANLSNLPQLDYEQLKQEIAHFDFQDLASSWQETIADTPIEQLGERLGQLSYESILGSLKTSEIAELLPETFASQIEGIQDYVAQQIESVKETAYESTKALKQSSITQAEATRAAIAVAAYWMVVITFSSAIASVLAGILATTILL